MSNTDGEGPQIFKCNACNYVGPRPDCFKVYCEKYDHTENSQLQQELASLREQLKEANEIIGVLPKEEIRMLNLTIKQQEEVIRELIPLARMFVVHKEWMEGECKKEKAIIEKAKSLTTKDK